MNDDNTVLVVDDEKRIADGYARILEDRYRVKKAYDGEGALDKVDGTTDVVLLDRDMPDLTGEEVASEIRDRGIECQIVMITGVDPDVDIIELKIDDYITKPVSESNLFESVEEALKREEYDETIQDYFSLSSKREVLIEEGPKNISEREEIESKIEEKAKKGIQKSREKLETLIQSSPEAIISLDDEGKVNTWNNAAEDMFGWSSEEVEDDDPPIFSFEDERKMDEIRSTLLKGEEVTDAEIECRSKGGSKVDVNLSAAPLHDPDNQVYGTIFVMTDITERKQREQRLDVMDRVLRHNLRNDLNVVIGRAEILMNESSGMEEKQARKVVETAHEIMELANKVREFENAVETGGNKLRSVELNSLVKSRVDEARKKYEGAEIEYQMDEQVYAQVNSGLKMALFNLIENAVEHNDSDHPEVRISVRKVRDDENPERNIEIAVEDNGPGIHGDEVEVLMSGKENPLKHASGVGLWTTKWVVERSSGKLEFDESELGGAKVTMLLREADSEE